MIDWFTSLKRERLFRITHLNVQLGLLLFLINIVTKKVNNLTINLVNLLNNLGFVVTNIVLLDLNRVPEKKNSKVFKRI